MPNPKWRKEENDQRVSTQKIINHLRAELWAQSMGIDNFSDFGNSIDMDEKPQKLRPHLPSAVLYAVA